MVLNQSQYPAKQAEKSQVQTYCGQLSNLGRSCLKLKKKKSLRIQVSAKALSSIMSTASFPQKDGIKLIRLISLMLF